MKKIFLAVAMSASLLSLSSVQATTAGPVDQANEALLRQVGALKTDLYDGVDVIEVAHRLRGHIVFRESGLRMDHESNRGEALPVPVVQFREQIYRRAIDIHQRQIEKMRGEVLTQTNAAWLYAEIRSMCDLAQDINFRDSRCE